MKGFKNETSEMLKAIPQKEIRSLLIREDPSTVLYNALIPFLVSVIEYFFSQSFISFIEYNDFAKKELTSEKVKFGIEEVLGFMQNQKSFGEAIANEYNFQNLNSINSAFRKYIKIDVYKVMASRSRIGSKRLELLKMILALLEMRHKFVHEMEVNYSLTKEQYFEYLEATKILIKRILGEYKAKGLTLNIDFKTEAMLKDGFYA